MRMGMFGLLGIVAASTALAGAPIIAPAQTELAPVAPAKRQRLAAGHVGVRRRSKGAQAKARKRSNRMHVSRRTRRKHRRAA